MIAGFVIKWAVLATLVIGGLTMAGIIDPVSWITQQILDQIPLLQIGVMTT
jgi:hypothetical protein